MWSSALAVSFWTLLSGTQAVPDSAGSAYARLLTEFRTGDPAEAIDELLAWDPQDAARAALELVRDGRRQLDLLRESNDSPHRGGSAEDRSQYPGYARDLETIAVLHLEVFVRVDDEHARTEHLRATDAAVRALVAVAGSRRGARSSVSGRAPSQEGSDLERTLDFYRVWYTGAIARFQQLGAFSDVDRYVPRALALFPRDPALLTVAGAADEVAASPLVMLMPPRSPTTNPLDGERLRAEALRSAERHLRRALAGSPSFGEARLRLGRVLVLQKRHDEALALLEPLESSVDDGDRRGYLSMLFRAFSLAERGLWAESSQLLRRTVDRYPGRQAANVALAHSLMRGGDMEAARRVTGHYLRQPRRDDDPWWSYYEGMPWLVAESLESLRQRVRR